MKISGSVTYRWLKDEQPPAQFLELRDAHLRDAVVQWRPDDNDPLAIRLKSGASIPMRVVALSESAHLDGGYWDATVTLESLPPAA